MMIAINSLAVLALVSKQRLLFLVARGRDVHVGGWHEAKCLTAAIDFKKIEEPSRPRCQVSANGQHAGGLMIEMRVDRPMGEDDVRFFFREQLAEYLGCFVGDFGGAVNLTGEDRFGAQDLDRKSGV